MAALNPQLVLGPVQGAAPGPGAFYQIAAGDIPIFWLQGGPGFAGEAFHALCTAAHGALAARGHWAPESPALFVQAGAVEPDGGAPALLVFVRSDLGAAEGKARVQNAFRAPFLGGLAFRAEAPFEVLGRVRQVQ